METFIWLEVTLPLPLILFSVALFAWFRRTPMWFFAGVPGPAVSDVRGFNRANAVMWALFSLPYFAAAGIGLVSRIAAAIVLLSATFLLVPCLVFSYHKICKKYGKTE